MGGFKSKDVDVTVTKDGIGPCAAISLKGVRKAFRNLSNRMEDAAGDCVNLHSTYPALVSAYWAVLRAIPAGQVPRGAEAYIEAGPNGEVPPNDVAILKNGEVCDSIRRYGAALVVMSGRERIDGDLHKYEATALTLVEVREPIVGHVVNTYPESQSTLDSALLFATIYRLYDLRFVYQFPKLEKHTRRLVWSAESPALSSRPHDLDHAPRGVD